MRTAVSRLIVLLGTLTLGIVAVVYANGPLSGHVRDQSGNAIPFAFVQVVNPETGEPVAGEQTSEDGSYSMVVPDEDPPRTVYDVNVFPPAGSGFSPTTVFGVVINGATTLNFSLTPPSGATFEGRLLDMTGTVGIPNQQVRLFPAGAEVGMPATTNQDGEFTFNVQTGSYFLIVEGNIQDPSIQGPQFYTVQTQPFEITGNDSVDFPLPVKRVTVHVQNGGGTAVANAIVSADAAVNCELAFGPYVACGFSSYDESASPQVTTDAAGNATLYLFPTSTSPEGGRYTFLATPPASSGYAAGRTGGVEILADTTINVIVNPPTVLTGRLLDASGGGMENQSLTLVADGQENGVSTTTGAGGAFSFGVQPGAYRLNVFGDNQGNTLDAPQVYSLASDLFNLTANQAIDFQLPAYRVNVHVQDGGQDPVENVGLSTSSVPTCGLTFGPTTACGSSNYIFDGSTVTDASGNVALWLFPTPPPSPDPNALDSYRLTATPPSGSGFATTTVSNIQFIANTTVTISLVSPVTVSGQLLDRANVGMANQFFEFTSVDSGAATGVITDADGNYSAGLQPGSYTITAFGDNQNFSAAAPQFYSLNTSTFNVSTDATQEINLTMPVKRLDVHVQDSSSTPIVNVGLSAFGPTNCDLVFGPAGACGNSLYFYGRPPLGELPPPVSVTDSSGNFTLWLFPTPGTESYDVTASPLADSGFEQVTVSGITLTDDATLVIVLTPSHASPVTTLSISPAANPDTTYPDPVTITLSATATAPFNVDTTYYEVDSTGVQVYGGPFEIAGAGPHVVRYFSVDDGGVAESPKTFDFTIEAPDTSGPVTTATVTPDANAAGWHNTDVTVQLHAVDDGGSGVQSITYAITGAQATPPTVVSGDTATISITTEGVSEITFFATDNAGNNEAPEQTLTIRLDKAAAEAYIEFDTATKDIAVFGRDALSGAPAGAVPPSSVVSTGPGTQERTYDVLDNAGNVTQLVVRVQKGAKQLTATVLSIKYGSSAVTPMAANAATFKWTVRGDGTLNRLEQDISAVGSRVDADFVMPSNRTKITRWLPPPVVRETRVGLALLRLVTSTGNLSVEY